MKAKKTKVTLTKDQKEAISRFALVAESELIARGYEWIIPLIKVIAQDQIVNSDQYVQEVKNNGKIYE